ncbi:MAG: 30S ribosomal protein S17 [Planctomycetes bacterium]|nr:30S ribosomal protein S17 [Planctomycetota bacterium]
MPRPSRPRSVLGVVSSDKMTKTITVEVERLVLHSKYQKYVRRRTKFKAHDEKNEAKIGDLVRIAPTRPLSKTKNWRLVEVLRRGKMFSPLGDPTQDSSDDTNANPS